MSTENFVLFTNLKNNFNKNSENNVNYPIHFGKTHNHRVVKFL